MKKKILIGVAAAVLTGGVSLLVGYLVNRSRKAKPAEALAAPAEESHE